MTDLSWIFFLIFGGMSFLTINHCSLSYTCVFHHSAPVYNQISERLRNHTTKSV